MGEKERRRLGACTRALRRIKTSIRSNHSSSSPRWAAIEASSCVKFERNSRSRLGPGAATARRHRSDVALRGPRLLSKRAPACASASLLAACWAPWLCATCKRCHPVIVCPGAATVCTEKRRCEAGRHPQPPTHYSCRCPRRSTPACPHNSLTRRDTETNDVITDMIWAPAAPAVTERKNQCIVVFVFRRTTAPVQGACVPADTQAANCRRGKCGGAEAAHARPCAIVPSPRAGPAWAAGRPADRPRGAGRLMGPVQSVFRLARAEFWHRVLARVMSSVSAQYLRARKPSHRLL